MVEHYPGQMPYKGCIPEEFPLLCNGEDRGVYCMLAYLITLFGACLSASVAATVRTRVPCGVFSSIVSE